MKLKPRAPAFATACRWLTMAWAAMLISPCLAQPPAPAPNVLLISLDDLNDWVGPLKGHPLARTPHMDRLAARGTTFLNAHCQAPLCNPSRTSLMLSLRPSTTGVYALEPWFRSVPSLKDRVPLFEHFRVKGYRTLGVGKLWHGGQPPKADVTREFTRLGSIASVESSFQLLRRPEKPFTRTPGGHPAMDWGPFPQRDEEHPDHRVATWAVEAIAGMPKDQPFLMGVGFSLPHVPCYAPAAWFAHFPDDDSLLPRVPEDDRQDVPDAAWRLHWKLPEPRLRWMRDSGQWRPMVRAYLASIAFADAQVGRVLDALDRAGLAQSTVVVLWSDHGWHLGEKGISGKNTLWERSTRVPLIFAGPGVATGARCMRPAELMDLYPTLAEMTRLAAPAGLEGLSLLPQLREAAAPRERPAITTHGPGNHAVRDERWRYIRYADGSEELYDMEKDPAEWTNLARRPEHDAQRARLARWLPAHDAPPAPGSRSRLVEWVDGGWRWEGAAIDPTARVPLN